MKFEPTLNSFGLTEVPILNFPLNASFRLCIEGSSAKKKLLVFDSSEFNIFSFNNFVLTQEIKFIIINAM